MESLDRLYFGTWQLGGQFKSFSSLEIEALLRFALDSGIRRFDTAAVYGGGRVEEMLGLCLPEDAVIVTKIPAIQKPDLSSPRPIQECYSHDYLFSSLENSLRRLRRSSVDTVLLHNWLPSWSSAGNEVLQCLGEMKNKGLVKRVGISLPDDFGSLLDQTVLSCIDVVEAPFNPGQQWILEQLPDPLKIKKEVLLRSLFCQGKLLRGRSAEPILHDALKLGTSLVIGMTAKEQITQNIECLKGSVT